MNVAFYQTVQSVVCKEYFYTGIVYTIGVIPGVIWFWCTSVCSLTTEMNVIMK